MRDKKTQWLFGDVRICRDCRGQMDRDGFMCTECKRQAARERRMAKNKRWQAEA